MKKPAIYRALFAFISAQSQNASMRLKVMMFFIILNGPIAFAQVGVHTDFPDASSAMDIYAINKGLLIPRVELTADLSSPSPVTTPATGLLVFNSGANQALGFYYWNGSTWVLVGGGSSGGAYWSLTGNAGTTVGTNFIGTTDAQDFALYTDESERMRITAAGNIVIGGTTPTYSTDLFTVFGKPGLDYSINAYSPNVGVFAKADVYGIYGKGGKYALVATVDTVSTAGYAILAKNYYTLGTGILAAGSNAALSSIGGRSAGISTAGFDGLFSFAKNADGYGIITMGSNTTPYTITGHSAGISAAGYDGVIAVGKNASGRGIIACGTNQLSISTSQESEGGAFTGYHGVYAKGVNAQGIGVIGLGSNVSTYSIIAGGLGGTFSGTNGVYGKGLSTEGTGVLGVGSNGSGYFTITGGSGGSFTGYHGMLGVGVDATEGTGVVGAGNNGNYSILPIGSGGAFTGTVCGVYGYATNTENDRYGGYFLTGGGLYVYVGGRYNGTNRKIVGSGNVSTIVKNTKGEIITLVCPEAPESLFQDYGIGQLVNGKAHIVIDPDFAININVSEAHPLKVYITPEGDCNGVYVANKSAEGFDVIELQGGKSNVAFSWQIVATRADEKYVLRDGSIEVSDYSQRFQPAPGPLEMVGGQTPSTLINNSEFFEKEKENFRKEHFKTDQTFHEAILKPDDSAVIKVIDDPHE